MYNVGGHEDKEGSTHRQLARAVQALNLVYPVADVVQQLVEPFFCTNLLRRMQDQHRIGRHIVVDLRICKGGEESGHRMYCIERR